MTDHNRLTELFAGGDIVVAHMPDGLKPFVLGRLAGAAASSDAKGIVYIASDGQELPAIAQGIAFFAPETEVLQLPAWDCLPYDRVSPSSEITARRIAAFAHIASRTGGGPFIVLTSVNALLQRSPCASEIARQTRRLVPGGSFDLAELVRWLERNGFERTSIVRERGEFAVRGGIIDLFPPEGEGPARLDFFGDTLDTLRSFDPVTQRTLATLPELNLAPMREFTLGQEEISRFRARYIEYFGAPQRNDPLYEAVSEGRNLAGMEHWLPLFHERLESFFELFADYRIISSYNLREAAKLRRDQIEDHYRARKADRDEAHDGDHPYNPVPPSSLYLDLGEIESGFARKGVTVLTPFLPGEDSGNEPIVDMQGQRGHSFGAERAAGVNVFDKVVEHAEACRREGQRVAIACWSEGSRARLLQLLQEHGLRAARPVSHFGEMMNLAPGETAFAILPLEHGFSTPELAFLSEQDILGDRLVRRPAHKRKASDFLAELTALSEGDIVVHAEHGIARFQGLRTIEVAGAPHDCLELRYQGEDKLFLPVENLNLLSRYGSAGTEVALDKLGGVAWQARKARLKKHVLEMAGQLIAVAAQRTLRKATPFAQLDGPYEEFVARFPYDETEDQRAAIDAVLADLAGTTPMDRLVCGDVGFGKTEVALRAAFAVAMNGAQVAVVVPTTLLARQHYNTFVERFRGFPINVRHISRLVPAKEAAQTRKGIADGTVDIVIGTHALLADSIRFARLGLLIIDEEQRFGVKHKEKLKEMKADVHVLTLSATPIPRTLQLALTGVRDLSLITTAPVDRLAVRTFIMPFDKLAVREALLRERYRGGQSFYVCPRVTDLARRKEFLDQELPELRVGVAHGQMSASQLDDVMNAFYERQYDVLLSTTIVESGLDIPTANTLIVHRADMFGLAQLYQLRGRVGRSKNRAYAVLTLPVGRTLTAGAEKRLKVLQSLDSIGAGFELASHDLDIRGAGNLLGEEQSGHVREVGYELYQQMLEEAVIQLRDSPEAPVSEEWSPQITLAMAVLIPESYVADLNLRLGLYRRLADLRTPEEIEAFGAELIDRFGPMPAEVEHLLKLVEVKRLCIAANIARFDAGPKGAVISFRDAQFANPAALIKWIGQQSSLVRIRPDQSILVTREWEKPERRLAGAASLVATLAEMAGEELSTELT